MITTDKIIAAAPVNGHQFPKLGDPLWDQRREVERAALRAASADKTRNDEHTLLALLALGSIAWDTRIAENFNRSVRPMLNLGLIEHRTMRGGYYREDWITITHRGLAMLEVLNAEEAR